MQNRYFFGWTDGDSILTSAVLGSLPSPTLVVLNYTSFEYYLADDHPSQFTEHSLLVFLQAVASGERRPMGGRGMTMWVKRTVYEVYSTVHK